MNKAQTSGAAYSDRGRTMRSDSGKRRQRGSDIAIELLVRLIAFRGARATSLLTADLRVPRASLYRISRTLAKTGLLDLTHRGEVRLGPLWRALAHRREQMVQAEDSAHAPPRAKRLSRASATSHNLCRHPESVRVVECERFRRAPKYKLGFANAAVDSPEQGKR